MGGTMSMIEHMNQTPSWLGRDNFYGVRSVGAYLGFAQVFTVNGVSILSLDL
jgi:hypothetical protein